jgi:hypothetical protein
LSVIVDFPDGTFTIWRSYCLVPANPRYFKQNPELLETYLTMTLQFISWVLSLILFLARVPLHGVVEAGPESVRLPGFATNQISLCFQG